MISKPLNKIDFPDITALIEQGVREGRTIEFKRELPGGSDADKKEFYADVSSFANAAGGDIIYGISETSGVASEIHGLTNQNLDAEALRLESAIRTAISPRIPSVHTQIVENATTSETVLVLRIQKSWAAPHMVTFKDSSRFYTRSSNGKFQMDIGELREAFENSSEIGKKIFEWRFDRLSKITNGQTATPLASGPTLILHMVPFGAFSNPWKYSASELNKLNGEIYPLWWRKGERCRFNLDGLLVTDNYEQNYSGAYTQVFRSGAFEAATTWFCSPRQDDSLCVPIGECESKIINYVEMLLKCAENLENHVQFVCLLSMVNMSGVVLLKDYQPRFNRGIKDLLGDVLLFPDVVIDGFETDVPKVLKPVFDVLWNAAGYEGSENYDVDGNRRIH